MPSSVSMKVRSLHVSIDRHNVNMDVQHHTEINYRPRLHVAVNHLIRWRMAAILCDFFDVVGRTRPRAIQLAMITMRKSMHRFPFFRCWSEAPLGGRRSSAISEDMENSPDVAAYKFYRVVFPSNASVSI